MIKNPKRLWATVFLLGWAFDLLFWDKPAGINFSIFSVLCVLGGLYVLLDSGLRPDLKTLGLLVPFSFFTIMTLVRREPLTIFLAYLFTFLTLGLLANTYLGGRWFQYRLPDYFKKFIMLLGSMLGRPVDFMIRLRKEREENDDLGTSETSTQSVWPVLRGVMIAIPIVVFFGTLLASADVVFGQKIADFFDLFELEKRVEYILRFVLILCYTYPLAGLFLHAAAKSKDEELVGEKQNILKPFLGFTEASIVLGSVAALFLLFVIVQFRYFFGGAVNIGVDGYSYSQYARRGFNELVMVACFSLVLILGMSMIAQRESGKQSRIFSGMNVSIAVFVLVILVSAYQRLTLAIHWHGFSRLRLYPRVFLIWVGILFVAVVALEIFRQQRYFTFAAILASFGFAISLSVLNVDASIVHFNVERAIQGKHFNEAHLASLSSDAIPALVEEFQNPDLALYTQERVGVALLCFVHTNKFIEEERDWRSFSYSLWQAELALIEIEDELGEYHVNIERRPIRVRTPGDQYYECVRASGFGD